MVTLVGTQEDFLKALTELIELDYDAVEAYQAAIERIKDPLYKENLEEFQQDHKRHIQALSKLIVQHGDTPPNGPDMKQLLLKGKVIAASILGDKGILNAMKDNEIDTNTAYERLTHHKHKWTEVHGTLEDGLKDEKRHKAWLESVA